MIYFKIKKSQAAMEFLMTYGWALLVVLIAVAALSFFGLLNPDRFLPDKVTVSNNVIRIEPSGSNMIIVKNLGPSTLYNLSINFTSASCLQTDSKDITPDNNKKYYIYCEDIEPGNSKFKSDFKINYYSITKGIRIDHVAKGHYSVTGDYFSTDKITEEWSLDQNYNNKINEKTLSCSNCPEWNNSMDAYYFEGGSYFTYDISGLPDGSSEKTICAWAWIKNDSDVLSRYADIASFGSTGFGDSLGVGSWGGNADMGGWGYTHNINIVDFWQNNTEEWHHICASYDSSSYFGYLDGEKVGVNTISADLDLQQAIIGAQIQTTSEYFIGYIDKVMIFNRSVSKDEIKAIYKTGR